MARSSRPIQDWYDEDSADNFFDRINRQSRTIVAFDPLFEKGLPRTAAVAPLADADARAASATLKAGAVDVIIVEAKRAGRAGDQLAVQIKDGQAGLVVDGAGGAASIDIRARAVGAAGTQIRAAIAANADGSVTVTVTPAAGAPRVLGPFATLDTLIDGFKNDPDVVVVAKGAAMPSALAAAPLQRRVDIDVIAEGRDTQAYSQLADLAAIGAISDPAVAFKVVGGATTLPAANDGVGLAGGHNKGRRLSSPATRRTSRCSNSSPLPPSRRRCRWRSIVALRAWTMRRR